VDYWLAANSWTENWGDKGYFKIRRGTNECSIEDNMVGGEADLTSVTAQYEQVIFLPHNEYFFKQDLKYQARIEVVLNAYYSYRESLYYILR